jgi:DNA-binding Xre family transcriptional regulator
MGLIASQKGLDIIDQARIKKVWARQAFIWRTEAGNISLGTLKRFLKGESIKAENFQAICKAVGVDWEQVVDWEKSSKNPNLFDIEIYPEEDCNEMPDVQVFYDRKTELENLKQSILENKENKSKSRVVAICGSIGIGKTTLAAKLTEEVKSDFEYFIWRSLNDSPPTLSKLLSGLIKFISSEENNDFPNNVDDLIEKLLQVLAKHRVLLVFDGWENVLRTQEAEVSQADSQKYCELLKKIIERKHKSCVVITSQVEPKEFSSPNNNPFVNLIELKGLDFEAGLEILKFKNLKFTTDQAKELINEDYRGNPLQLLHICEHIQSVFDGELTQYKAAYTILCPLQIETAISEHFKSLPSLNAEILKIIATESKPINYQNLKLQIQNHPQVKDSDFQEALKSLFKRSLIERSSQGHEVLYSLQPVIRKCVRKFYGIS